MKQLNDLGTVHQQASVVSSKCCEEGPRCSSKLCLPDLPTHVLQNEPSVRYCPGCGHVGPVEDTYRDCCPDGNEARTIPHALAEKCRDTFKIAIGTLLAESANDESTPRQPAQDAYASLGLDLGHGPDMTSRSDWLVTPTSMTRIGPSSVTIMEGESPIIASRSVRTKPEPVVMGLGNVAVGTCTRSTDGMPGIIYLELAEARAHSADCADIYPVGGKAPGQRQLACIYFTTAETLQQSIDVLHELQAAHYPKPSELDAKGDISVRDYGDPIYLDGDQMQYTILRGGPWPQGDTIAYVRHAADAKIVAAALQSHGALIPASPAVTQRVDQNTGHGHVWKRPDGFLARCGGPKICKACMADAQRVKGDA